jgi:hypothetical protein
MSKLSKSRRVATIKRNQFNAVCESLEGRQLLSTTINSISPIAPLIQGQPGQVLAVTFNYSTDGTAAKAQMAIDGGTSTDFTTGLAVGNKQSVTLTEAVPTNIAAGNHTVWVHLVATGSGQDQETADFAVKVNVIATTVLNVSGTSTYGSNGTVTATLQANGVGVNGKTIAFSLLDADGNVVKSLGSATTATVNGVDGVAVVNPAALAGIDAGLYKDAIKAEFVKDATYDSSSATGDLTIAKANATIGVTGYSVTYNGSAHTATGSATGVNGEDLSGLLDLSGTTHTDAGNYATDTWTFAGNNNYNAIGGTVTDSIAKANAIINVTGYSVTYDGSSHTATGSATGVQGEDLSGLLNLNGTTHTNAGTYTDSWSFAGNNNYNAVSDTPVTSSIAKATLNLDFVTQAALNIAKQGDVTFTSAAPTGLVGSDDVNILNGVTVYVTVPTNTATIAADGTATFKAVLTVDPLTKQVSFSLTMVSKATDGSSLYTDLAGDTTATSAAKVSSLTYFDISGSTVNYTFVDSADIKLFNSTK